MQKITGKKHIEGKIPIISPPRDNGVDILV